MRAMRDEIAAVLMADLDAIKLMAPMPIREPKLIDLLADAHRATVKIGVRNRSTSVEVDLGCAYGPRSNAFPDCAFYLSFIEVSGQDRQ